MTSYMGRYLAKREAERQEKEAIRRGRASIIVNGQPIIGGMRIMDANAEDLFRIILSQYDGNDNRKVTGSYDIIPVAYHHSMMLEFEKLSMYGVISASRTWNNDTWSVILTKPGITYFEDKKVSQERDKMDREKASSINIENMTSHGGNIFLASVTNSTFSIDNSISNIEKEIDQKAGEDAEALKAILEEVKELIENINDSRHIPKSKGLFQKITGHFDKHGWFYAEIVGLLGTAAMTLLGG